MKIAITGAAGLFGHGLAAAFGNRHEVIPLTHAAADITNPQIFEAAMQEIHPDVIVHSAAIPDLDICEADPDRAFLVNCQGTQNVASAAIRIGAGLVHISTDAVFDGKKQAPYVETDATAPITVYGRSKLQAEQAAKSVERYWIIRVPVLFGPGKTNFVEKGLRKLAAGEDYKVASDQMGNAALTIDAGLKIMEVVESGRCGLYHVANQGACSRFDLARAAAKLAGLNPAKVIGVPDAQMQRKAPRLKYSVLEMAALKSGGFSLPRPWQEALAEYIRALHL